MIMKTKEKIIQQVLDGFQRLKGRASFYCFTKDIIPDIVFNIILKFHSKNKNEPIFIVVDKYETRKKLVDCFKNNNMTVDDGYNIKILSADYVNPKYHYSYKLIITVGINDKYMLLNHLYYDSKFMISILTENIMDNDFITRTRQILPNITIDNISNKIRNDHIYSPVEEHRVGVDMTEEDQNMYNKYTNYINDCISIFGDLKTIEKCKYGDEILNISATEFRNNIAKQNGWRSDLDPNIEFYKQIDNIYNPNVLEEKARNFYNIAKLRRDLCTDNEVKLNIINDICNANKDKKILIVSKRGEYAAKVTKFLNDNNQNVSTNGIINNICGDYHDCIPECIATDDDGNPIYIKSGVNKGQFRILKSQAQSTLNEKRFNNGSINILSIKQSSNVELKIACDMVIFTSTLCDNIIELKTRFNNVKFNNNITKTYRVYCNSTIEEEKMLKEKISNIIMVINDTENNLTIDEISGDIIL